MKKILLTVMMLGIFSLMPIRPIAMLQVDEKGNPIDNGVKEGEITTMMTTDEGYTDGGVTSDEGVSDKTGGNVASDFNQAVSNENKDIYTTLSDENDEIYQTTSGEEYETNSLAGDAVVEKSNTLLTSILYGVVGIIIGSLGTIFVMKRKKL